MGPTRERQLEKCKEVFKKYNLTYDVSLNTLLPVIEVFVEWGDWKHDHIHLEKIMEREGFKNLGEKLTEEDGSDTYSAIHLFI